MIHVYCGDGKGKTTACAGMAVRAAGNGLKVLFVQFLKARQSGEIAVLSSIENITVIRAKSSRKFTYEMNAEERKELVDQNRETLEMAFQMTSEGQYDFLILDEVITAVSTDMIDEELLKKSVECFHKERELVMTGRSPERWMIEAADYVTDMEKIRHPFDRGIQARKGIEF